MIRKWKKILGAVLFLFVMAWIFYFSIFHISHPSNDFKDETRYLIVRRGQSLTEIPFFPDWRRFRTIPDRNRLQSGKNGGYFIQIKFYTLLEIIRQN